MHIILPKRAWFVCIPVKKKKGAFFLHHLLTVFSVNLNPKVVSSLTPGLMESKVACKQRQC